MSRFDVLAPSCTSLIPLFRRIGHLSLYGSLLVIALLAYGCASKAPFYDPAQALSPNEGLLAIMSHNTGYTPYSNEKVSYEFLNASKTKRYQSGTFADSVQFGMVKLPAGTYYLSGYYLNTIKYGWSDDAALNRMKFQIEPNKINYFGDFILNYSSLTLQDNQDMTEDFLEQKYPQAYKQYGLVYTLISE